MGPGASRPPRLRQLIQGQAWLLCPHKGVWHVSLRLVRVTGLWPIGKAGSTQCLGHGKFTGKTPAT